MGFFYCFFFSFLFFPLGGCGYRQDSKAFLFTLVNYPGRPAEKLEKTSINPNGKYAFYNCMTYGPTFGAGWDIYIADNAGLNTKSSTGLKYYGYGYRWGYLIGSWNPYFTPDEVEVYYETT